MAATPEISGNEYCFVDAPHDGLMCKECSLVPSGAPYRSECCGRLFCKSCLDGLCYVLKASATCNACPGCDNEILVTNMDDSSYQEIKQLRIYCINKKSGCEWQGKLNDINNHLRNSDGCQFEEVKCSNECGKMMERQYLTSHMQTECPHQTVGKYTL